LGYSFPVSKTPVAGTYHYYSPFLNWETGRQKLSNLLKFTHPGKSETGIEIKWKEKYLP
jgi:hypothetical protein